MTAGQFVHRRPCPATGHITNWRDTQRCAVKWLFWGNLCLKLFHFDFFLICKFFIFFFRLRTPHSALRTPHSALRTPHSAFSEQPSDSNCKTTGFGKFKIHYLNINVSKQSYFFFFHHIFSMFNNTDISLLWKQVLFSSKMQFLN